MANRGRRSSRTRLSRSTLALRCVGTLVLVAIAVGYVHPIRAYRDARAEVAGRRLEVARLAKGNAELNRSLKRAGTPGFVEREARRLGLVRPGERLFIVIGVDRWRKDQRARAAEKAGLR
jgi:cell division protein FtsB